MASQWGVEELEVSCTFHSTVPGFVLSWHATGSGGLYGCCHRTSRDSNILLLLRHL
jgi:hypothetical protein